MALSFDWLGIAEGSANDTRGALTLVGVGQNVLVAPRFPHREQRVLVVTLLDEDGTELLPNVALTLNITITTPAGTILLANRQTLTAQGAINPAGIPRDVPARGLQVVMATGLEVNEYGAHVLRATVTPPSGHELVRTRNLYVVRPPTTGDETE